MTSPDVYWLRTIAEGVFLGILAAFVAIGAVGATAPHAERRLAKEWAALKAGKRAWARARR